MDREIEALKQEMFRLAWFMRGGVTMNELYQLDITDFNIMNSVIAKNLETAKETGLPFF